MTMPAAGRIAGARMALPVSAMICSILYFLAIWNGKDPILKERLFGLTNAEGNHGEDVKELYYYLDATPTNSYLKMLYKYPQSEFPYLQLIEENARRGPDQPEYELLDTGIFETNRYFDVFVEYAKAAPDDILMLVTVHNRGPEAAKLTLLPQICFRNIWSWNPNSAQAADFRRTMAASKLNIANQAIFVSTAMANRRCFFARTKPMCAGFSTSRKRKVFSRMPFTKM